MPSMFPRNQPRPDTFGRRPIRRACPSTAPLPTDRPERKRAEPKSWPYRQSSCLDHDQGPVRTREIDMLPESRLRLLSRECCRARRSRPNPPLHEADDDDNHRPVAKAIKKRGSDSLFLDLRRGRCAGGIKWRLQLPGTQSVLVSRPGSRVSRCREVLRRPSHSPRHDPFAVHVILYMNKTMLLCPFRLSFKQAACTFHGD
jgi:hypothetical protein